MADINKPLQANRLSLAQHCYRSFGGTVPAGTTFEAASESNFWTGCAHMLRPFDQVRVLCEDNSWAAEFMVLFVNGSDVRMEPCWHTEFSVDSSQYDEHPDYEVKNGGVAGFYIKDMKSGKKLLDEYFKTRSLAYRRLEEYVKTLKTAAA